MVRNKSKKKKQLITYFIVAALSFIFIYPFWQTFVLSFSTSSYAAAPGFKFWPMEFTLDAYKEVFTSSNSIYKAFFNTIFRTAAGTLLTLIITYCAAYAMAHRDLPGWSFINVVIVFTMFFSGGLIPTYLNLKALGLINTIWVLILPGAAGAWNFLVMRNFISSISKEMEEAARIDGAGPFQTMIKIFLPLSKASIAVIGLWSMVGHWNSWFDSLVYANKKELLVLQVLVQRLLSVADNMADSGMTATVADSTSETVRAATVMITSLPILMVYPFLQKYLVKGVMVGAVKA